MWTGGMSVQIAGWVMYVTAVSQAPVSMVAVMMQGGIALFVIFSVVVLGERARPAEWAGIIAIVVGMILLSMSLSAGASQGAIDGRVVIAFSIVLAIDRRGLVQPTTSCAKRHRAGNQLRHRVRAGQHLHQSDD